MEQLIYLCFLLPEIAFIIITIIFIKINYKKRKEKILFLNKKEKEKEKIQEQILEELKKLNNNK